MKLMGHSQFTINHESFVPWIFVLVVVLGYKYTLLLTP